ncbi:MAG TPA: glycosyltransferase family 9 protein [Desulfuromonadales bacterium]|nr:glycosyltransferase family 9 protein [Desulfuromonadales bacterium]
MNIRLMKLLDAAVGRIATSVFPAPSRINPPSTITSLLLIRPGGIGDALLLAPAIRTLNINYPRAQITVLAERRNAGAFSLIPGVAEVFCYDRPRELFQALQSRYDIVIDTEQWHRLSAVVARLVSAQVKIGFDTNERRRMFTHVISYSHDDYEAVSFAHLVEPLGIGAGGGALGVSFLSIPDAASAKTDILLASLSDEFFITLFPGASITERQWGADRFQRVAEILTDFGIKTVVVGGNEDQHQGEVIVGNGPGRNLAGMTSLSETAAIIKKSAMLLSADSGVLHLAVGLGVPTVSLFGSGRVKKWAPEGEYHHVINKELPCSPCTIFGNTPACPDSVRCMRNITVDEVVNAVTTLLTGVRAIPSRYCTRE